MRTPKTAPGAASGLDFEIRLLAWLAACASVLSFLYYLQRGEVLLYGDAVAHINIARRVFDSKTPGLLQLGTVWLPLPHLLMIPFLVSDNLWRSGVGGSIPSMIAYVFATVGIFRLVRDTLGDLVRDEAARGWTHAAAWIAAFVFAANPSLLYMQATAMGESLYLALFIWAVVYCGECLRGDAKALTKCGLCLTGACWTRYDAWFLAAAMIGTVALVWLAQHRENEKAQLQLSVVSRFILISAAAPALWLAYNGIVYRNPLEFENGPYSAKAIEQRAQSAANPGHPGSGNVLVGALFFVKAAESNMAVNPWVERLWICLLIAACALVLKEMLSKSSRSWVASASLWLLLVPLPFYALSVAYGGVPIFVPEWWPHSHYNVRYGLQLLPAFAVAAGVVAFFLLRLAQPNRRLQAAIAATCFVVVIVDYGFVWHSGPVSIVEARLNMRTRSQLEVQLARWLEKLPQDSTLLMYLGDHVGAVERAGIPLDHVINEGNHRVWKQPTDPDGLWERALADPAKYADYVVAFEGDRVWQAVQSQHLRELVELHVSGQARAVLYRAR